MSEIAVFDIDGTVYRDAMSFVVAETLISKHDFPEASELEDARQVYKSRGSTEAYWEYNKTILDVFKCVLIKTTPAELDEVITEILETKHDYCYAYSTQLIQKYKQAGRTLIAISGSIANIVEPFSKSLGFDFVVASALEVVNGKFTGERATETKQGKDIILQNLVREHGLSLAGSVGVGDTHRDIPFLAVTEHPIAFNPNVALYEEAQKRGWDITLERKNMIYELTNKDGEYILKDARPIFDSDNQ